MQASIVFQTRKGYHYLYDANHRSVMLVHPSLSKLISLRQNGNIEGQTIDSYHKAKYEYLKQYGWFGELDQIERLNGLVSGERVQQELANLKQLTLEVTDACNLKCKYCGLGELYDDHDDRHCNMMDFDMAKSVIDYMNTSWNSPLNNSYNSTIYQFLWRRTVIEFPFH